MRRRLHRQVRWAESTDDEPWQIPGWLWAAMVILSALIVLGSFAGCSAKSAIDTEARSIDRSALVTKGILNELRDASHTHASDITYLATTEPVDTDAIVEREAADLEHIDKALDKASDEQQKIQESSSNVRTSLSGVEDKVPMWQRLLYMLLVALSLIALIWLGTALGIFALIRRLLALVRIGIPRRVKTDAKLDAELFAFGVPTPADGIRVTDRRNREPAYDIAFQRAKLKAKLAALERGDI